MPRIRKKTSNRASTNDRAKVRHKVRETRRKKAKAAKKNPQWKSRKPKDPGIPNEFPYKDQILAEIAEERRKAVEEKERMRAEKQKAGAIARGEIVEDASEDGEERGQDEKEREPKQQKKGAKTKPRHLALTGKSKDKSEPEVYDFGKFF